MKVYRQGDVIIKETKVRPKKLKETKKLVLAEGEVTGHAHRISEGQVQLYEDQQKPQLFLQVVSDEARVTHEEHDIIELPKGDYTVITQREYDWYENKVRKVLD